MIPKLEYDIVLIDRRAHVICVIAKVRSETLLQVIDSDGSRNIKSSVWAFGSSSSQVLRSCI